MSDAVRAPDVATRRFTVTDRDWGHAVGDSDSLIVVYDEAEPTTVTDSLDVELFTRTMFHLVGTAYIPDLDTDGIAHLATPNFAQLFIAEYARLRAVAQQEAAA